MQDEIDNVNETKHKELKEILEKVDLLGQDLEQQQKANAQLKERNNAMEKTLKSLEEENIGDLKESEQGLRAKVLEMEQQMQDKIEQFQNETETNNKTHKANLESLREM